MPYCWSFSPGDHWDNVRIVHDSLPDKHLLYTEGGIGGNWPAALRLARNVIYDLNNWTEGWVVWNLMCDQQGGPRHAGGTPGPGSGTIVNADTTTGQLSFNPPHYVFGQFSCFIRPGAKRIPCTDDLESVSQPPWPAGGRAEPRFTKVETNPP